MATENVPISWLNLLGAASVVAAVLLLTCQILMLRYPAIRLYESVLREPAWPTKLGSHWGTRWLVLDLRPGLLIAMVGVALLWAAVAVRFRQVGWLVPVHYAFLLLVVCGCWLHAIALLVHVETL